MIEKLTVSRKALKKPDETRKFRNGKLDVVKVGEFTIGRSTLRPGWKWSKAIKPSVKTESCQSHHVGFCISGKMEGVMDDGTKWVVTEGDVIDLPPGHDAWVVGKKPVVFLDFMGASQYAKR